MARRYGRSPLGERLAVAGLRQSGIVASLVLDRRITGPAFRAYVEQLPAPALAPGDVVVLDNLSANRSTSASTARRRASAVALEWVQTSRSPRQCSCASGGHSMGRCRGARPS
jgi:hypothetical protein